LHSYGFSDHLFVAAGDLLADQQDPLLAPLGLALSCAIVGHMLHMSFDIFQNQPAIQVFWICCALSLAICNILKSERTKFKSQVEE
jgi:FtsH-binding integral membrane protein